MKDNRISKSEKKSISEFNTLEVRGWIIERFCTIEFHINQIIINHIKPNNSENFEKIILNSSIISFGSKIKILRNISDFDKSIIDKINKSTSIRNVFAHASIYESIEIDMDPDSGYIIASNKIDKLENNKGQITSWDVHVELNNYFELTQSIIDYLSKFISEGV